MKTGSPVLRLATIAFVVGALLSMALTVLAAPLSERPERHGALDTTSSDTLLESSGVGESLILVVAGRYGTQLDAEHAAGSLQFGDLQGYYIESTNNLSPLTAYYVEAGPGSVAVTCTVEEARALHPGACEPDSAIDVRVLLPVRLLKYDPIYLAFCSDQSVDCHDDLRDAIAEGMFETVGSLVRLPPDQWVLVSAFRTKAGAEQFLDMNHAGGVEHLSTIQVRKLGGGYIGLGQEEHPDGSGPLLESLPDQEAFQQ
jgi:hypothetical protein